MIPDFTSNENNWNEVLSTSNLKKNSFKVSSNLKSSSKRSIDKKFLTRDSTPDECIVLDWPNGNFQRFYQILWFQTDFNCSNIRQPQQNKRTRNWYGYIIFWLGWTKILESGKKTSHTKLSRCINSDRLLFRRLCFSSLSSWFPVRLS